MSAHTPGPYRAEGLDVLGEDDMLVAYTVIVDDTIHPAELATARADAVRIARALTLLDANEALLAACEEMLAHEVYTYEGNLEARITVPCDAIDQLRAAIAKARPE